MQPKQATRKIDVPLAVRVLPALFVVGIMFYVYAIENPFKYSTFGDLNAVIFFILNIPLMSLSIAVLFLKSVTKALFATILIIFALYIYILYGGGLGVIADIIRAVHS